MPQFSFINGDVVPAGKAVIGINDLGLLRGYAAFDYLRTYNGRPFRFADHISRFRQSAAQLHLPLEYTDDEIKGIIQELLEKSDLQEAAIRFVLTGGYSPDGMTIVKPNFIISAEKLTDYPSDAYTNGVKLMTYEFHRHNAQSKTTEYLTALRLQPVKKENNAFDILYRHGDEVLEITRNNFFIIKDHVLITPREGVLLGITRKVILELAAPYFKIEERKVMMEEVKNADEAFLCGTSKRIIPVIQVDDFVIGDGQPGSDTKKIMQLFDSCTWGSNQPV